MPTILVRPFGTEFAKAPNKTATVKNTARRVIYKNKNKYICNDTNPMWSLARQWLNNS